MRRPLTSLVGLPLIAALIISGCANMEPAASPVVEAPAAPGEAQQTEQPTQPEEPVVEEEPDPYPARWPLTGVGTDEIPDRPALLIKVENSTAPGVRPQTGLEYADILYEVVVEGGITRYIAVYNSELPEAVVPVRSARPTDIPLVTPYRGVFVFSGAQQAFITAIETVAGGINQALINDRGVAGLTRVSGRAAPHNVSGDPLVLLAQANDTRQSPPPAPMLFARDLEGSTAMQQGTDVSEIDIRMSNIQQSNFRWDAERGQFLRFDGNSPSMTTAGVQLGATNLILIEAVQTLSNVPNQTAAVPFNEITGHNGRAIFAAGGKYVEGTWTKIHDDEMFVFMTNAGEAIYMAPGNTFVQIVPKTTPAAFQIS